MTGHLWREDSQEGRNRVFNDLDSEGAKGQDGPGLDVSPCKLPMA